MASPAPGAKRGLSIRELCIFSMLGAVLFASKIILEWAPNIHLLGMFIMVYTLTYRVKALIPIYIYVMVNGIYAGFGTWWVPYLYVWTVLWAMTMVLPKKMPRWLCMVVYPIVCALHGFGFGVIYAPGQALLFGFNFKQTLAWIASGFYFDMIHGVSNFAVGFLILPLTRLLKQLNARIGIQTP
ncbi:MAG: hypothetical protein IJ357_03795 [Oscillospiraceae bacterium]|nr:hypothetical protein [Ruminiclostridium sp.]MBQ7871243.1 hypothetical protein [Oscillospiraceae bacterium]